MLAAVGGRAGAPGGRGGRLPVARDQQDGGGPGRTCSGGRDYGGPGPDVGAAVALLPAQGAVYRAAAAALGRARGRPAAVQGQRDTCANRPAL